MSDLVKSRRLFPQQLQHFTFPSAACEGSTFPASSPTLVIPIPEGAKHYLIVVLIRISLMAKGYFNFDKI